MFTFIHFFSAKVKPILIKYALQYFTNELQRSFMSRGLLNLSKNSGSLIDFII